MYESINDDEPVSNELWLSANAEHFSSQHRSC